MIGFYEDLSKRSPGENRLFGQWYIKFRQLPRCDRRLRLGWLGFTGLGGLEYSREDAVRAGVTEVTEYVRSLLESPGSSCRR